MKRKIEDYINKGDYAVLCSSIEEWNKVNDLLGKKGLTRNYGDISAPDNTFVDCIHINGIGTASKKYYEQQSYVIYSASDFLEEDILEQCKKKYPVGTKFKSLTKDLIIEIKNTNFREDYINSEDILCNSCDRTGNWYVYKDGKFAEIIEETKKTTDIETIKEKYPIGCTFIDLVNNKEFTVRDHNAYYSNMTNRSEFYINVEKNDLGNQSARVFKDGKWAEIVKKKESKYTIGKWYKSDCGSNIYYNKITKIDKRTVFCERVLRTQYINSTNYSIGSIVDDYSKELTDLSEIQQYLPSSHVDKQNVIPEYVEYIDTKYKGQIVKVEEWTNHSFCCIRFENGQREQPFKDLVKLSTKEAYEAQNKPKQLTVSDLIEGEIYKTNYKEQGDYIPSIIKKQTKLQTITIESSINLNLNLTQIQSKQIKTIKI